MKTTDKKSKVENAVNKDKETEETLKDADEMSTENKDENAEASEANDEDGEKVEVEQLQELSAEDEALNTKYMRLAADFQNYKRRVEKEKNDIYAYANEKIVVELLNVIDNFERALEHAPDGCENYAEGMNKIFKQLTGVLEKSGVKEIAALGEDFDPAFHHAVMTESSEKYESGKVTEVLQKGYTLKEKEIRPAMVKVAE